MGWKTELKGYVKFLRGTPAAWADLAVKDSETLYFISDTNGSRGKLYLGSKLISDGSITQVSNVSDLQDVLINAGVTNNSILVYNTETQKWESKPIEYVLSTIVAPMTGATADVDGTAGLVPTPVKGQQNLYLQGNGTWSDPTISVKTAIAELRGVDTTGTVRDIAADEVAKVVDNAPEKFDTLKEIASWIANHDEAIDIVEITGDVADLKDTVYGPESSGSSREGGLVDKVQTLEDLVNGTEQTVGLVKNVNNLLINYAGLNNDVTTLTTRVSNVEEDIQDIDNRLRWEDLVYEEGE